MADVIDVLTRLSFDVNFAPVTQALGVLNANISALGTLQNEVANLQNKLKAMPKSADPADIQIRNQIISQINQQRAAIDALIASNKRYAIDHQAQLQKEIGLVNALAQKVAQLTALRNESNDIAQIHQYNIELEKTANLVSRITSEKQTPVDYTGVTQGIIGSHQTRLDQLRESLPFANTKKDIADINREIQKTEQALIGLQTLGRKPFAPTLFNTMAKSSNSAYYALNNIGRVVQDLPYGFLGIANNLNPLLESFQRLPKDTGSAEAAMKSLGNSLLGAGGIGIALSVVSALLVVFGDKLFRTSKAAEEAADSYKKFLDAIGGDVNTALTAIDRQTNRATLLFNAIENGGMKAKAAIKELRDTYPQLTKNITDVELAAGKGLDAIQQEIKAKETSNLASETQLKLQQRARELRTAIASEEIKANKELAEIEARKQAAIAATGSFNSQAYQKAQDNAKKTLNILNKDLQSTESLIISASTKASGLFNPDNADAPITADKTKTTNKDKSLRIQNNDEYLKNLEGERNSLEFLANTLERVIKDQRSFNTLIQEQTLGNSNTADLNGGADRLNAQLEIQEDINKKRKEEEEAATKRSEANLHKLKEAYYDFAQAAIAALNMVYDRQISLLDKELDARRSHLDYAVTLAERGNVELLNSERDRIQQLEQQREQAARRQIELNAIIAASNSAVALTEAIGAVVKAASAGDPYTIALRVAAAVAALVAGIAAIKGAFDSVNNFAGGVIDLNGPGTGTSDSIRARLSRGESVMTAAETKEYKPYLMAMREGNFETRYMLPVTKEVRQNNRPSLTDKKLDRLIEATEANGGVKMEQKLDADGFSQRVEQYKRHERMRFNY